jgi:hypothetical protein
LINSIILKEDFHITSPYDRIIEVKDLAASLLTQVILRFREKYPDLKDNIYNFILNYLFDPSRSNGLLYYGCLRTLQNFGPKVT